MSIRGDANELHRVSRWRTVGCGQRAGLSGDGSNYRHVRATDARRCSVPVMMQALLWTRGFLALVVAAAFLATAVTAVGSTSHGGPLTGTWSGFIAGQPGTGANRQRILIIVNAKQNGGSWKLSDTCQGPLTLDSISNGYHHYLRKLARGSTCSGGDIDCLKRVGADVYDAVTSHRGGEYDASGTLHRSLKP